MSSEAESEIGALFITAKEMIPLSQKLIEMGWTQPPSPIHTDNSTAVYVVRKTIVPRCIKSMDMRFHWLRCFKYQGKFQFYWAP